MPKKPGPGKKTYPSRQKVSYTAVPKEYVELLRELAAEGQKYESRSVAFLTRVALRAFLQAEGKLDDRGRRKT